jgi:hypothetical protein
MLQAGSGLADTIGTQAGAKTRRAAFEGDLPTRSVDRLACCLHINARRSRGEELPHRLRFRLQRSGEVPRRTRRHTGCFPCSVAAANPSEARRSMLKCPPAENTPSQAAAGPLSPAQGFSSVSAFSCRPSMIEIPLELTLDKTLTTSIWTQ